VAVKSCYNYGYIDEKDCYHVCGHTVKGYITYSHDLLIKSRRVRGIKNSESVNILDHKYIGKSFIDSDNKKKTIKEVWKHFGFGVYYVALYEDEFNSHGTFVLESEGNAIEKLFDNGRGKYYEFRSKSSLSNFANVVTSWYKENLYQLPKDFNGKIKRI